MSRSCRGGAITRLQTIAPLSDEPIRLLVEEAARRGISRSALISDSVEAHLADGIGCEIADGYRRIPPAARAERRSDRPPRRVP